MENEREVPAPNYLACYNISERDIKVYIIDATIGGEGESGSHFSVEYGTDPAFETLSDEDKEMVTTSLDAFMQNMNEMFCSAGLNEHSN